MNENLLGILGDYLKRLQDDRRCNLETLGYGFDDEIYKSLEEIRLGEEKTLRAIEEIKSREDLTALEEIQDIKYNANRKNLPKL